MSYADPTKTNTQIPLHRNSSNNNNLLRLHSDNLGSAMATRNLGGTQTLRSQSGPSAGGNAMKSRQLVRALTSPGRPD